MDFIDVAKGIGIIFVVISHINYTQPLLTIIYSFHMPLFFILSGMMFNSKKYLNFSSFLKRKLQMLICPYVLFYLLSIIYHIVVQAMADFNNMNWDLYFSYFKQMFLSQGSANLPNAPLWFVPCLFAVEIIYYFISKFNIKLIIIFSASCSVFGWILESGILQFNNTLLPWSLDSAMFAIGFFAIGNLSFTLVCRLNIIVKASIHKEIKCIVFIFICVAILIPLAIFNGKVSLGSKILNNGFVLYLTGIIGFSGVLASSFLLRKNKFLVYCGKNSFYIMSIHYLCREALRMGYKFVDIPIYDKTSLVETIIPIIIVLALSLLFTVVYNKIKSNKK